MKFFSKIELKAIGIILLFIFVISFFNFDIAIRRSRDAQRREDLGAIYNALGKYQRAFGYFPISSSDGRIKACKPDNFEMLLDTLSQGSEFDIEGYMEALLPCRWGVDALKDIGDDEFPPFMEAIPVDPGRDENINYTYLSNGRLFQIYAYLEGEDTEIGYSEAIVGRDLACGIEICNFGRAFGKTPLDKSLEEYENELSEKIQNSL